MGQEVAVGIRSIRIRVFTRVDWRGTVGEMLPSRRLNGPPIRGHCSATGTSQEGVRSPRNISCKLPAGAGESPDFSFGSLCSY
jgi:hypothetical protein